LYSEQQEAVESRLKQEKGNFGLLFFYSPNCGYCVEQSGILKFFINKYKWDIEGVDVTREPDAKVPFNRYHTYALVSAEVVRRFNDHSDRRRITR
ncbi:MAG TPA: conjugal transfer protein TraF, partial [Syntrophales bacterium]|nr:conjugal transfer protein TraF [Syntrophales bacterium]